MLNRRILRIKAFKVLYSSVLAGNMSLAEAEAQLRAALPGVHIVLDAVSNDSATGNGWRSLPRYYAMRDLLGMEYMED